MMKGWLLCVCPLVVFFAGCTATPRDSEHWASMKEGIHTILADDASAGEYYNHIKRFRVDEVLAVVVTKYGGKTVTAKIYNTSSSNFVRSITLDVPWGNIAWGYWRDAFPVGSYRAVLEVGGISKGSTSFTVYE